MGTSLLENLPQWFQRLCFCSCLSWETQDSKEERESHSDRFFVEASSLPAQQFDLTLKTIRVQQTRFAQAGCKPALIKTNLVNHEFFTEYGEGNRYQIQEVIGRGSYGVVCSAIDTHSGEKVAIKKINDIFEHVSDATRILREIKLLRLLRHPDIVEIKHIILPPSPREFKDIYVVFELMESDLHQVIKANDDLTPEHYQFFLYQLLRALKYIHTGASLHGIGFPNLLRKMFFVNAGFGAQMVSGVVDMEP